MVKACRCNHCGQVIAAESLIVVSPDPEWLFTLEDDEPIEWLCPLCLTGDVPADWVTFYLPTERKPDTIAEVASKEVQGELF